jgi:hypothetical protein
MTTTIQKHLSDYQIAYSAGTDAGNRRMRSEGRERWNQEDYAAAATEFNRVIGELEKTA